MNPDNYTSRQSVRDAEYLRTYKAWINSLPASERRAIEAAGLAEPSLQRYGSGSPGRDAAESHAACVDPVNPEPEQPCGQTDAGSPDLTDVLQHLVAELLAAPNTRLTLECLALALGLSAYNGESMSDIAKRHGLCRAAVSKRCVDITRRLNLRPSRAMRSEAARAVYRRARIKRTQTTGS
jgi:hypothetical protein